MTWQQWLKQETYFILFYLHISFMNEGNWKWYTHGEKVWCYAICHLASEYTRIHTDRISRAEMIQHATFSERRWDWWFYQNQLSSNKQPKLHTTCPCENCIWNGSLEKSPSFVVCISIKGSLVFMEMCYIYAYIRRNKYTHTLMPTLFDWSILFVQIGWISVATHISNYGYKKKAPKNTHTHALTMK